MSLFRSLFSSSAARKIREALPTPDPVTTRERILAGQGADRSRPFYSVGGTKIHFGPDISEAADSARSRITGPRMTATERAEFAQLGIPRAALRSAALEQLALAKPRGIGSLIQTPRAAPLPIAARTQIIGSGESGEGGMREGGIADMAENVADRGRAGDSMMVHMTPEEVQGLQALAEINGTSMTINPYTGMPEAFSLKKIFKGVSNLVKNVAKVAAPILPFIPIPGIAGLSPLLTRSLLAGTVGGLSGGKGFDFKRGLTSGLMAYGIGSLAQNADMLPGVDATGGADAAAGAAGGAPGAATQAAQSAASPITSESLIRSGAVAGPPVPNFPVAPSPGFLPPDTLTELAGQAAAESIPSAATQAASTAPTSVLGRLASITPGSAAGAGIGQPLGTMGALGTTMAGYSLGEGIKEQEKMAAAQRAIDEEERKRLGDYSALFSRTLGQVTPARAGGLMTLAGGGMTYMEAGGTTGPTGVPRDVTGTGDGMSDSVPATIEGIQEARLADGEFVIPADVVADIGNGSSNAGSKKLYDMMDRIRKARHGTTEQPPEITAERMMPA